ncbi:MAG: hypothetical protein ACE5F9_09565 [Phycisphaerae bacterium]
MLRLRFAIATLIVSMALGAGLARADEKADGAVEKLASAIIHFENGDYAAAQDLLRAIDVDDLQNEDHQLQYQRYKTNVDVALRAVADARDHFDSGEARFDADDRDAAAGFFRRVLENKYAPRDLKDRSRANLAMIDAMNGDAKHAEPEPAEREESSQSSLVGRLAEEHDLLWQHAVSTYRDLETSIRKAVLRNDFAEAQRLMDRAKDTIRANRRYASPAEQYDDYQAQALDLDRFINDQQREWDEHLVHVKQQEIEERERARIEQTRDAKRRQVSQLMDQAAELRKEQRYEDAIEVLKQVLGSDPTNERALWMKETLEDIAVHMRNRSAVTDRHTQSQDLLVETEEALIPWHKDLLYPKNWPEISAKRTGAADVTETESNRTVRRKLRETTPELKFDGIAFEQVVDYLRDLTGLNIVVNWTAMEFAAIERDAEVNLKLQNVRLEKALDLILDGVGGGEVELAYEIDEGVVTISTKEDLSRRTKTLVYSVEDLLHRRPNFRGRDINLDQIGQNQGGGGGGGGGGGDFGGLGGSSGGGGGLFEGGGGENLEDEGDADPLQGLIDLIQATIDPESWRATGGNVGSLQTLNNQIIVTQTSTAHDQMRDLLKQLRRARALQIAIEVRYITVTRNYLEQIGVDLDIVLNNGNAGFDRVGFPDSALRDPATGALVLVPRQFSRLGFTPGAPGGVGLGMPTQGFPQPFGQPGLVPLPGGIGPSGSRLTPIPMTNNTLDLARPIATNVAGTLGGVVNPAFQVFGSFLDNIQVDFLLRATQVDRRANDVDAPRIVLHNGQRATFEAFIEQDYVSSLIPVLGDNVGLFQPVINTALTGRSIDVQATVGPDRKYVTMTVRSFTQVSGEPQPFSFNVNAQSSGTAFVQLIRRTTQQIRTTVSVPDGGTLLIGGLKQAAERESDAGVPILSRIPILKRAFSNTSLVKDDSVLLILIKPKIIIQEEAEAEAFPTLASGS